jgi:hypothetical protein
LRVRPRLAWRDNIAFPVWAAAAAATAGLLALTPAGQALRIDALSLDAFAISVAAAAAGVAVSLIAGRMLDLRRRL